MTENGDFIIPDTVMIETQWYDAAAQTIQLKTPFTIAVTKTVPIVILRPALGEPLTINVQISASARGISEVYFKK